jgi:hypothetical protein
MNPPREIQFPLRMQAWQKDYNCEHILDILIPIWILSKVQGNHQDLNVEEIFRLTKKKNELATKPLDFIIFRLKMHH